jgi:HK97 family phage prohead protease
MTQPTAQDHIRTFRPDLEVRSSGDGRTIYGIAVPWNTPTRIDAGLVEEFMPGAFDHQLRTPNRVKFAREHMLLGGELIGAASLLRNDAAGLYTELRVSRTPKGDETLELVKDGALNELSIAFREKQNRKAPGGIVQRVTAHMSEIAITNEGAYGEKATTMGYRSAVGVGQGLAVAEVDLRIEAERYLHGGLRDLPDHELEIRSLRLGVPF